MALVAMVVVALLGGAVAVAGAVSGPGRSLPSASEALEPVDGFPQRIDFERPSPKLPDRPGPLAATMDDNDFGNRRPLGVTSAGALWELGPGVNSLSPDGRLLLTRQSRGRASGLVVHDLTTGNRLVFDNIGDPSDSRDRRDYRYVLDSNAPVHWSPDGSAILTKLDARPREIRARSSVVDVASGQVTAVPGDEPAGFRSLREVVTVSKEGGRDAVEGIVVTMTDLETGGTKTLPLRLDGPWIGPPGWWLSPSVSPGRSTLLLVEASGTGQRPDATLRLFSLADGGELPPRTVGDWDRCEASWLGQDPVIPTKPAQASSELVTADESRSLVAVHHRMQSSCLQITPAALSAGPNTALFGTSTAIWTWYWWQLLLALSLALLGAAGWLGHRQRSRGWG